MFKDQESSPYGITGDYVETVVPMLDYPDSDTDIQVDSVDPVINVIYYYKKPAKKKSYSDPLPQSDSDSEINLNGIYEKVMRQEHRRTIIPDVANGLADVPNFENAIPIPQSDIQKFNDLVGESSAELANKFTQEYLPMSLSLDHASAYVEAFMRDGIDIPEFQIDGDLSHHIHSLIKLDTVSTIVKKLKLPKAVKTLYFDKLVTALFDDANNQIKSQRLSQALRYKSELNNPVGIKSNSVGSVALRSQRFAGSDYEEKTTT